MVKKNLATAVWKLIGFTCVRETHMDINSRCFCFEYSDTPCCKSQWSSHLLFPIPLHAVGFRITRVGVELLMPGMPIPKSFLVHQLSLCSLSFRPVLSSLSTLFLLPVHPRFVWLYDSPHTEDAQGMLFLMWHSETREGCSVSSKAKQEQWEDCEGQLKE